MTEPWLDQALMDSAFRSVVAKQARSFQRFPKGKPFKNTCCVYFLKISKTLVWIIFLLTLNPSNKVMKSWNLSVSLKLIYRLRLKVMMSKICLHCFLHSLHFLCTKESSVKWLYFYKMKCIYTGPLGRFVPLYILPMLANLNPESRNF